MAQLPVASASDQELLRLLRLSFLRQDEVNRLRLSAKIDEKHGVVQWIVYDARNKQIYARGTSLTQRDAEELIAIVKKQWLNRKKIDRVQELATALGITKKAVYSRVERLRDKGLVVGWVPI
jgi:DNA-binding MarR family transcriptional regulator